MGRQNDLHPFLRLVLFGVLLQEIHHALLQLRMEVGLRFLDEQKGQFFAIAKQDQFGGHEQSIVVAKATRAAGVRTNV